MIKKINTSLFTYTGYIFLVAGFLFGTASTLWNVPAFNYIKWVILAIVFLIVGAQFLLTENIRLLGWPLMILVFIMNSLRPAIYADVWEEPKPAWKWVLIIAFAVEWIVFVLDWYLLIKYLIKRRQRKELKRL